MRTAHIHYIDPSAISITPNCNNSANDLAVYITVNTKIKVYCPKAGLDTVEGDYQTWTLKGRNRRLADSSKKYTIYARLSKTNRDDGYLVFAPMNYISGEWMDKYNYVADNDRGRTAITGATTPSGYWYFKLGEVTLPDGNEQRTVTLDTGILGTEDFNTLWALNPDALPLRIELGCTINGEDAGPTPYVYWGQTLVLTALLTEGWTGTDIQRFDHWEILRDTGNTEADNEWNAGAGAVEFQSTGVISLAHGRGQDNTDDFNSVVNTTFTIIAMGREESDSSSSSSSDSSSSGEVLVALKTASINIMAETWETYGLQLSSDKVTYNPQTGAYSPNNGVTLNVKATDQKSETFLLTKQQVEDAGLVVEYAAVDDSDSSSSSSSEDVWTAVTFQGQSSAVATANIPKEVFYQQKSINVRLRNSDDPEHNTGTELFRTTIAFLKDGEDSKEREWIFLRSTEAITFGDASSAHPKPSLISGGQVNPTGAATGSDTNKNQDSWVPEGWWDEEQGVDVTNLFEYGAYRDYDHDNDQWGAFTTPKIWHHYGQDAPYDVLTYGRASTRVLSSGTPSGFDSTTGWQSVAPATSDTYPYIWQRTQHYNSAGQLTTTSYTCLTGEKGGNGKDAQYIYLKGTARDEDSETTTTIPCVININGGTNQATILRGLNLVTFNRQTLAVVESINYDTYGQAAETGTGITNLITKLDALDNTVFVCLVSYDAVGWNSSLISALQGYGLGDLPYTETGRCPFLFIGYKDLGKGNGLMRMHNIGAYTDVVELAAYVANGALTVKDGENGEDAVNVVVSPASMIVEQDINNKDNIKHAADNNLGRFSIQVLKGSTACTIISITASASRVYISDSASTGDFTGNECHTWQPTVPTIADMYLKGIGQDNEDNYYTTGEITLTITYTDPDTHTGITITDIIIKVYVNLIGSWSETVVGDAKYEVAKSLSYAYDPTGENVIELENFGQYIKSSTENISTLTQKVSDGKNLLSGVLTGSGWRSESGDTFPTHQVVSVTVDDNGFFVCDSSYNNKHISSPLITLSKGVDYALSFEGESTGSVWVYVFDPNNYQQQPAVSKQTTTAKRKTVTFNIAGTGTISVYINIKIAKLRYPQLETGTTATAFESIDTEISSRIKQTADEIEGLVNDTGVNIQDKTISLYADKVKFYKNKASAQAGDPEKIWIDGSDGSLHAVDGMFSGTVKADILFRNVRTIKGNISGIPDSGGLLPGITNEDVIVLTNGMTINGNTMLIQLPDPEEHLGHVIHIYDVRDFNITSMSGEKNKSIYLGTVKDDNELDYPGTANKAYVISAQKEETLFNPTDAYLYRYTCLIEGYTHTLCYVEKNSDNIAMWRYVGISSHGISTTIGYKDDNGNTSRLTFTNGVLTAETHQS